MKNKHKPLPMDCSRLLIIATGVLMLSACLSSEPPAIINEKLLEQLPCPDTPHCDIYTYEGEPYTGIATRQQPENGRFSAVQLEDGRFHGFGFKAQSQFILESEYFRHGLRHGDAIEYHDGTNIPYQSCAIIESQRTECWFYEKNGAVEQYKRYQGDGFTDLIRFNQAGQPIRHEFSRESVQYWRINQYYNSGKHQLEQLIDGRSPHVARYTAGLYEQGQLKFEERFDESSQTIISQHYSPQGVLTQTGALSNASRYEQQRVGEWRWFDKETGKLKTIKHYQDGKLLRTSQYTSTGDILSENSHSL